MGVTKKDGTLRDQYVLRLEIGLVLALALLIVAFRVHMQTKRTFQVQMQEQETVDVTEIQQTKQEETPPPPPSPPVPVEVPNNEVIEQESPDFDASLDMDQALNTDVGPPPSEEKKDTKEEEQEEIFVVVEDQPKLIGGIQALQKAVEYPPFARKAGIQGRVIVQFVVNEEGNVENPHVTRGVHKLLDKAAIEAIKKQKFKPGRQRGEPVKVRMSLPVTFRLKKGGG